MYCIHCGVELSDSETVCPLCGTRVFHPDLPRQQGEPPFPPEPSAHPEEVNRSGALFILTMLAVLPIVICFQSMVLDMAGNVGTQSLAVTIRVLVDENLTTAKKLQLLWKEMRVGLTNGALLAVLALGFLGGYIHFFKAYAWGEAFLLSGCVGVSLVVAMVISSLVGTVIPMLFHKIHIDPAVASGPLITTINDLVAVVVYYGLAAVVLIDMFHLG